MASTLPTIDFELFAELNAEPEVQTTITILATLPWSFKLLFGFLSDVVPIHGQHRKPYLTLGAMIYSASYVYFALVADKNVMTLALATFIGTMGMIMMDVMADTMVFACVSVQSVATPCAVMLITLFRELKCVERSRFEREDIRGQMQSSYYSIRFGGSLLGSLAGALVSNRDSWGWGLTFPQVALINGCIPFLLVTPWLARCGDMACV